MEPWIGWAMAALVAAGAPPLRLPEAVAYALDHHPEVAEAAAATARAVAEARVNRAPLLPQITGDLGYSRASNTFLNQPGSIPNDTPDSGDRSPTAATDYFRAGLAARQLLWDGGVGLHGWRRARVLCDVAGHHEANTRAQVVREVRLAYFRAQGAVGERAVLAAARAAQARRRDEVAAHVAAGRRPEIDRLQVDAQDSQAEVDLLAATARARIAHAAVDRAMGREDGETDEVGDEDMAGIAGEDDPGDLLRRALLARHDFRAARRRLAAQRARLEAVRASWWPTLAARGDVTEAGQRVDGLRHSWSVGAELTWPLFAGGATYYRLAAERQGLASAQAAVDLLRQSIRLAVERARLEVASAAAQGEATATAHAAAGAVMEQAERRYRAGVGSIFEVGQAQLAATRAAAQVVQRRAALAAARAALAYEVGM